MSTTTNRRLHQLDQKYYLSTYKRFPLALERGEGCYVWDVEGTRYLDTLAGIAVNNVGHCHPRVVQAIQEQAARLIHISNFFVSEPQVRLSQKLAEISGIERVFLTNSGAESLEGAIKFARKYAHAHGRGGTVISFTNSFHGRTLGTIATGKPQYQHGFEPIPAGFTQVEFNNIEAVRKAVNDDTAAILIEPIQGEGGINVAERDFLHQLRRLCTEHNIVLIFDEVQCGVGRTGHWFAKDYFGVQPDIMTLAKGMGGGTPVGAILSNEKVSAAMDFGDHGTTFGGNPLVSAAALATLEVIEEEGLMDQARENGEWLRNEIAKWEDPAIVDIRGVGLMIGIEFEFDPKPLVMDMLKNGVIANATAGKVLRLVPPLVITRDHLQILLQSIKHALENIRANA